MVWRRRRRRRQKRLESRRPLCFNAPLARQCRAGPIWESLQVGRKGELWAANEIWRSLDWAARNLLSRARRKLRRPDCRRRLSCASGALMAGRPASWKAPEEQAKEKEEEEASGLAGEGAHGSRGAGRAQGKKRGRKKSNDRLSWRERGEPLLCMIIIISIWSWSWSWSRPGALAEQLSRREASSKRREEQMICGRQSFATRPRSACLLALSSGRVTCLGPSRGELSGGGGGERFACALNNSIRAAPLRLQNNDTQTAAGEPGRPKGHSQSERAGERPEDRRTARRRLPIGQLVSFHLLGAPPCASSEAPLARVRVRACVLACV